MAKTASSARPKIIIVTICLLMMIASAFTSYAYNIYCVAPLTDSDLQEHGIDNATKLMIVAHPDDDILWGGGHLYEKGYFVVVLTNRNNVKRNREFNNVLEASGNNGIILSYPDKSFGTKDSWSHNKDGIKADIEKIINYKHWDLIVTHNKDGEYGHIHHKMTHGFVRDVFDENKEKLNTKLYFFGKYYNKSEVGDVADSMSRISPEALEFKEKMLKLYPSQKKTIGMFDQMNPFEEWQLYDGTNG